GLRTDQTLEDRLGAAWAAARDRRQAAAVADRLRPQGLVLDDQDTHVPDVRPRRVSPAYRETRTPRQHRIASTGRHAPERENGSVHAQRPRVPGGRRRARLVRLLLRRVARRGPRTWRPAALRRRGRRGGDRGGR